MPFKVALINMPFGFHIYPSIQLGTLSTLLKAHDWEVKSYYLNLHFAHQLDPSVYSQLCEKRYMIGEWLFSHMLYGDSPKNQQYTERFKSHVEEVSRSLDRPQNFLLEVKTKMAPEFLTWAVDAVDWSQYGVVGFSSTFNQNLASVTLAKLIKEKYPQVKILFGGSNFDAEMGMEYFRVFDWIDYVVSGEAEHVLPQLMQAIDREEAIPPGVIHRQQGEIVYRENHEMFSDFSQYGPPDYDDYFDQLKEINPQSPLLDNPIILYETARGCWWGEKHHCTFCGLNASAMKFRSRSIEQVHADIAELSRRYDTFRFRIVDNILELKYIEGVFGKLAQENFDLEFFIEVKSNLTKQQIKMLAHGGVNVIQPGIESFSSNQLLEMDKGVRPLQNIFCLKWSAYYGIEVTWSILTGFPRETDEDFRRQIDLIKLLIHLQPPISVGHIWLERFSPYFMRPEEYGIKIKGPGEAYPYVYSSNGLDLMKVAYDFEFETERQVSSHLEDELRQVVAEWKARHQSDQLPYLLFTKAPGFVTIYDGRSKDQSLKIRLEGSAAKIISFCNEAPKTQDQIRSHIMDEAGQDLGQSSALEETLQDLQAKGLICKEKEKYLTLALSHNPHL